MQTNPSAPSMYTRIHPTSLSTYTKKYWVFLHQIKYKYITTKIINHSTLHQKRTSSICIYLPGIDTDPVTYPTDTRQRRRSIPMLSHIPRGWTQAPHSHIRAYTPRRLQKIYKILSVFISNKIQDYYDKIYCILIRIWLIFGQDDECTLSVSNVW